MEAHRRCLSSLCRICTRKLGRVSYDCRVSSHIQECFQVAVTTDDPAIHPPRYCNTCYLTMQRMIKAQKGAVYRTSLTVYTWLEHQDVDCNTCVMVERRRAGGRPKNRTNILGCPKSLTEHIQSIAGPRNRCFATLGVERFILTPEGLEDFVCRSCRNILDEPVELPCRHVLCYTCCITYLKTNLTSISCPHCQQAHPIVASSFLAPPPLMVKFLAQLVVKCEKVNCLETVYLSDLQRHMNSNCKHTSDIRQTLTLGQILGRPATSPPTRLELETAGHVVKKILSQSQAQAPFSLPTGGYVSCSVGSHYI